jgi:ribosomal protein S18 acetylase RimI-like enzyme
MIVERATGDDYDAVRALDRLLAGVRDRGEALRSWIAAGECVVARDGNVVPGFAVADCSFFAQGFLVLLVVHPDRRRQGIASMLVRYVEEHCPAAKLFTSTNRSNTAMQAVLRSLGFLESGVVENLDEGDPELIYFKRLREP